MCLFFGHGNWTLENELSFKESFQHIPPAVILESREHLKEILKADAIITVLFEIGIAISVSKKLKF